MEIELLLDLSGADSGDITKIEKRLREWHAEGAEIRYDKRCFGGLTPLEEPNRYRVDLGSVDPLDAIRDLHARIYRYGAKVYIYFVP